MQGPSMQFEANHARAANAQFGMMANLHPCSAAHHATHADLATHARFGPTHYASGPQR